MMILHQVKINMHDIKVSSYAIQIECSEFIVFIQLVVDPSIMNNTCCMPIRRSVVIVLYILIN